MSLRPDHICTAELAFRPLALGEKRATLTVQHSAPQSPYHLALRGTGT